MVHGEEAANKVGRALDDGEKYDAMYGQWVEIFYFFIAEYKGSSGCWFRGGASRRRFGGGGEDGKMIREFEEDVVG